MARGSRGSNDTGSNDTGPEDGNGPDDHGPDEGPAGEGPDGGSDSSDGDGTPGQGACIFCQGHHDPSVHTVRDRVGGGGGGGGSSEEASSADVDVYVELDNLAIAGYRLFAAAEGLDERVRACLRRVHLLESGLLAGGDETGRAFHGDTGSGTGYDASSGLVCEALVATPLAYKVHAVAAQGAAKAYADTDDSAAADAAAYIGIWGT